MRNVIIKKVKNDDKQNYAEVIIGALRVPENRQLGANYEEMTLIVPIIKKLQDIEVPDIGEASILLEEAEWEIVCKRLKNTHFQVINEGVLELIEDVASTVEAEVKVG